MSLPAEERRLTDLNATTMPSPRDATIVELFESVASSTPEAVALVCGEETWTYAELNRRANRVALRLMSFGVGPEVVVAIGAARTPRLVAGLLGILKAGGAYLPLEPIFPAERLAFMASDARPAVLLADEGFLPELSLSDDVGRLDLFEAVGAGEETNPRCGAGPTSLAYVMYTSGSSGTTKGVEITHGSLANLLESMRLEPGFNSSDRLLAVTTVSFDIAALELFLPLVSGGCIVLASSNDTRDARRLVDLLEAQSITVMQATPATWQMLVDSGWDGSSNLRVLCGGETLFGELAAQLLKRAAEVWNMYGPTETTIWSAVQKIENGGSVGIGRPISNTCVHILDENGEPLPMGAPGELFIGGDGLARGYLNLPELTAERFVPDPFGDEPGGRLYRTGDRVRSRPDGTLEFLGRFDHQVKVRGFRVELGEIESHLRAHSGVRDAVVVAHDTSGRGSVLVAYLIETTPGLVQPDEIRGHLRHYVPEYMVPAFVETLDAFPLTPNGKINRRALPDPRRGGSVARAQRVPCTPTEYRLVEIWEELLELSPVGVADDFIRLGGSSLDAIRLATRIESRLGVDVGIGDLLRTSSLSEMAAYLDSRIGPEGEATRHVPPIVSTDTHAARLLSFSQQRLWFLEQLDRGAAPAPISAAIRIRGRLDTRALERSLSEIVRRHEVLRTVIESVDGQPMQRCLPACPVPLDRAKVKRRDESDPRSLATEELASLASRTFDLTQDLPIRVSLLVLAPDDHVLSLVVHHIAVDEWSMRMLLGELGQLYSANTSGRGAFLLEPEIQYSDFAVWQRNYYDDECLEAALGYWQSQLAQMPESTELPTDYPRPHIRSGKCEEVRRVLPEDLVHRLRELCREQDATLFMATLAAFSVLLSRLLNQSDIVLGSPAAGRERPEIDQTIGCFLNNIVLRTDLSEAPSFTQLLTRVRSTVLGALEHQHFPFDQLVRALDPVRQSNRTPLFQIMFNMHQGFEDVLSMGDLDAENIDVGIERSQYDLEVYIVAAGEELIVRAVYDSDLYESRRIHELLAQYEVVLEQIAQDPEVSIDALSFLTSSARTILDDPAADIIEPTCLPLADHFKAIARAQPDATAVMRGDRAVTYAALARWARGIRASLPCDLPAGTPVAVAGDRSLGLVAAALAVLHTRFVLLLLDPTLPSKRKRAMLTESGARCLIWAGAAPPEDLDTWCEDPGAMYVRQVDPDDPASYSSGGSPEAREREDLLGPTPEDPAYIFFTSGSTGVPKAVLGKHKCLSHFLTWQRDAFNVGPDDRVAQLTSISFDVVMRDIFLPLISGATLCLPAADEDLVGTYILRWLRETGVTVVHAVPTLAEAWLGGTRSEPPARSDLRVVFFAGEPLLDRVVVEWLRSFGPDCQIVNLYGPTETSLAKYYHRVASPPRHGVQPVGRPLPSTQTLLLGSGHRLCGLGEIGEIVIRTPFRGQYMREEANRDRFIPNPFNHDPDDVVYRTGDLGRYTQDGVLEIIGRADDQVKIHGVRIELGEIASHLLQHPSVRTCTVRARKDDLGQTVLHAYVVPADGAAWRPATLRRHLRQHLPWLMVPAAFVALKGLPLLPNGKIDTAALPEPASSELERETEYVGPRDRLERRLVQTWEQLFETRPIGIHDNFFDLGGHSLLALQLVNRVFTDFGQKLRVGTLFDAPTIGLLARHLEAGAADEVGDSVISFNTEGPLHPLFALPGIGGSAVFAFRDLAAALGTDQPLHSLQLWGHDGFALRTTTVEEMAARQIKSIRRIQPEGPYALVGYSFGGRLALEVAIQLRAAGESVAMLAMIDSSAPGYPRIEPFWRRQRLRVKAISSAGFGGGAKYLAVGLMRRTKKMVARIRGSWRLPSGSARNGLEQQLAIQVRATRQAAVRYKPQGYAGEMLLFRSMRKPEWLGASFDDPLNGWGDIFLGPIQVHPVPGKHLEVFDPPNIEVLAARLRTAIQERT